mgnify:CR=1 FL=1
MNKIKSTGTKWYIDIEYEGNIARFDGEMCTDGFYANTNAISWIKYQGNVDKFELSKLINAVQEYNKNNKFKIYFVNDDGNEYK